MLYFIVMIVCVSERLMDWMLQKNIDSFLSRLIAYQRYFYPCIGVHRRPLTTIRVSYVLLVTFNFLEYTECNGSIHGWMVN